MLASAIASRSLDELDSALKQGTTAQLEPSCPEMAEAARVKARVLEEQAVEAELLKAADSASLAVVEAALAKATAMGMTVLMTTAMAMSMDMTMTRSLA